MQSVFRLVVIIALASLCAVPAAANECAGVRQHLVIARRALEVHDYARAVAEYQASYEEDGDPLTLVLLARTEAERGQLAAALDLYRSYLADVPTGQRTLYVEREVTRLSALVLDRSIQIFDDDGAALPVVPILDATE